MNEAKNALLQRGKKPVKTKKALVPVVNGKIVSGQTFALPALRPEPCLISVPRDEICRVASVVYTGKVIEPIHILEKLISNGIDAGADQELYFDLAELYLGCVRKFKVGDFVEVDEVQDSFALKKSISSL